MTSPSVVLPAVQPPRFRLLPTARSSAGLEAVELAASAGLHLDDGQAAVLEGGLAERADGKWAAFEVGVVEPRQNGKGSILEALELAGLFLLGDELILHSAHEFKTAADAFRRLLTLIQGCDDLDKRVSRVRTSHGDEGIELRGGQRLRFVARSSGSGRGFSADRVILDEAYNLPDKAMSALMPTMMARPNPQLWYTSSAPLPGPESDTLRRLCRRGRAASRGDRDEPRLAYFEWSAEVHADPGDPVAWRAEVERLIEDRGAWAQANPALGVRIDEEFVAAEKGAMAPDDFARETLGIWLDPLDATTDQVLPGWEACRDPASQIGGDVRVALDVSHDRQWSAFGVAGAAVTAGVQVELADYLPGTAKVVARAAELQSRWGGPLFVADKSPASKSVPDLEAAGVVVRVVTVEEHAQACAGLFDAVRERQVRHLGDPALRGAIRVAVQRPYGDAWLWSRRKSGGDICGLVAVTLAHWALGQDVESIYEDRGMVTL